MRISEITRRNIFDTLRVENVNWAGRLDEPDFLSRIFDLEQMPSYDSRFKNAAGDIWQHRIVTTQPARFSSGYDAPTH